MFCLTPLSQVKLKVNSIKIGLHPLDQPPTAETADPSVPFKPVDPFVPPNGRFSRHAVDPPREALSPPVHRPPTHSLWPWVPHPCVEIYSATQPAPAETQLAHEELFAGLVGYRWTGATSTDGRKRFRKLRRFRTTAGKPFQPVVLVKIAMYVCADTLSALTIPQPPPPQRFIALRYFTFYNWTWPLDNSVTLSMMGKIDFSEYLM